MLVPNRVVGRAYLDSFARTKLSVCCYQVGVKSQQSVDYAPTRILIAMHVLTCAYGCTRWEWGGTSTFRYKFLIFLGTRYAMSGTDIPFARPICLCTCYAISGTGIQHIMPSSLRACYAMSGTDIAYQLHAADEAGGGREGERERGRGAPAAAGGRGDEEHEGREGEKGRG
eukprot:143635-Rhodomonas_salina.1